ncbi:Mu-like prophage major head subunit gpT family protein [Rhodobacteraceae bacterium NNCM2]|nr:Mu-like prophage major head subunit gpT family protein [Coraliihabitans acroporae]
MGIFKKIAGAKPETKVEEGSLPSERITTVLQMAAESRGLTKGIGQAIAMNVAKLSDGEASIAKIAEAYQEFSENCRANNEAPPSLADAEKLIRDGASAEAVIHNMGAEIDERHPIVNAPRSDEAVLQSSRASVGHSWDHGSGFQAKMIDGLRAQMNPEHRPDAGREYASMGILGMAQECARMAGMKNWQGRKAVDMLFQQGPTMYGSHGTSDFPLILSGAINQEMAQAYIQQMPALMSASRKLSAPDFRIRLRPRLSTGPELHKDLEGSELTYGTFHEDGEYAPVIWTWRKGFTATRALLINDNLSAFSEIPREMARGAISTVRKCMVALLEANSGAGQTMRDGKALFHADHGNLASSGGAISVTSVNNAVVAMRRQKGLQDEVIDIRPWALVVPPELELVANQVVAETTPNAVAEVNPFSGRLEVIVEPGLTDPARWYICADPMMSEGLAHSYLDESNGPRVEDRIGWEVEGMEWKVILDFGAAFIDYRSWYMNPGSGS